MKDTSKHRRSQVQHFSPLHVPDTKIENGSSSGGHVLIDYVTTCPTGSEIVAAAARAPLAAAADAESSKRVMYGPLKPHELVPFAVEDCGGLGADALALLTNCSRRRKNILSDWDEARSTWSSDGFTNYWISRLAFVTSRKLGEFFVRASNLIKEHQDPGHYRRSSDHPERLAAHPAPTDAF